MAWVHTHEAHERRFGYFSQLAAVLPNAVKESGVCLDLPKKNLAAWAEDGLFPFHTRHLPRLRAAVERGEPQPYLALAVGRVENDLAAVRRDVVPRMPAQ